MEKVEMKFKMPSGVQMANAERFRASVDPESEAGSVVHIYAQAVAALKERLDAKPADAPKTMPHLNDVLGWRERAVTAEADVRMLHKNLESSVAGLGKSRVDKIAELEGKLDEQKDETKRWADSACRLETRLNALAATSVDVGEARVVKDFNLTASIGALSHNLEKAEGERDRWRERAEKAERGICDREHNYNCFDPNPQPCNPNRKLRFDVDGMRLEMCLPRKVGA